MRKFTRILLIGYVALTLIGGGLVVYSSTKAYKHRYDPIALIAVRICGQMVGAATVDVRGNITEVGSPDIAAAIVSRLPNNSAALDVPCPNTAPQQTAYATQ